MVNRKKIIKIIILTIIMFTIVILFSLYITDSNFRLSIDKILNKEISEDNLKTIEINSEDNPKAYAYYKNIVVLEKGVLKSYDKNANVVSTIDINITKPLMNANGGYLVIAENGGKDFFVIFQNQLLCQNSVEGAISKITINSNGYVSVIVTNTTYKSVVIVFNNKGVELFKSFSSSTYALCSDISNNNRYLAIGEVDYTGTVIKSKVKIISIDLARNDPKNSIVNSYESESGEVITNINYHKGDNVYCVFSSYIERINQNETEKFIEFDNNVLFADIYLKNNLVLFEKHASGLFSCDYQIRIINLANKKETLYFENLNLIKSLKTSNNNIILNYVNSVQILNKNGGLSKKYTSTKEIKDIVLSDDIIGIIYKDKIQIINL